MTSEAASLFNSRASASTSTSFFSCLVGKSDSTSPARSPNFSEYLTFINFTNAPTISTIPDHPEPIQQITAHRLSSYFNKSSWHPWLTDSDSNFDRSSVYSSCPSINSSFSSEITPPTPPPRRAESFLCVSNHLYIRAVAAQRSYYDYLSFVSNRHNNFRMTQETGPTVNLINPSDDNQSFQTERSFDEDVPSPNNELTTPSYTPPPPIDSSYDFSLSLANAHELDENVRRRNPPLFAYSYDPPSPEIGSEYDPPFFSPPPSNISKSSFQVNDQKEDDFSKTSNVQPLMRPDSDLSSSTLSATLLLTQDSDVSPLPPHADRVSSLNTDTLTSSSLNTLLATSDPSATYTCTSPAFSYNSDTLPTAPDLSKITMNDFDHRSAELENLAKNSPDDIEAKDSCTPDTICVSPLLSERASQSHSKTSEEPSLPTRSMSESRKKSTEGTTGSSDRARRSSPPSSPDLSLSSLPSDTITMNTGIDSIGTDTDSNENPASTQGNRNRASESVHSQDETDQTTDSAFASPSTSPTCTLSLSCSVTPVPGREKKSASTERRTTKDSDEGFDKETFVAPSSDENIISDEASTTKESREKSVESNLYADLIDETAESESIYPESECEIRLVSRADTDSAQRDSSPDNHTTPIIAELCNLEEEKTDKSELPEKIKESTIVRNLSSSSMKEISSSGNSSMSNSPALSAETNTGRKFVLHESRDEINSNENTHLSNWLHNSRPSEIHSDSEPNYDSLGVPDSRNTGTEVVEDGIIIEEISSDLPSCPYFNGSRSLPSFGPLPTIHEVADTPTDITPVSDAVTIPYLDNVDDFTNPSIYFADTSSIISSFVHSDSPQAGSSSASLFGNKNSAVSIGNLPPPPPPRSVPAPLKTPPLPPPPADDDGDFNPFPLPPPPSEEACLPPLPPPPVTYYNECAPPVPPHSVGPTPPQRMYLLIPLAPGLRSPQRLLSPPPAPPRSTSLRRSPPPPVPSIETSRLAESNSSIPSILNEDINEDDRTISSPSDVGSVICVSSKLTPLPEELSPAASPLPPALLIASNDYKTSDQQDAGSYMNPKPNLKSYTSFDDASLSHTSTATLLSAPTPPTRQRKSLTFTPPPIPPQPVTVTLANNSNVNDKFSEIKLTDYSHKMKCNQNSGSAPPPPPPPKPAFLKDKPTEDIQPCPPRVEPKRHENSSLVPSTSLMSVSAYGKLVVDRSDIALPNALEEVGRVFTSAIRWGFLSEGVDTIATYTQIRPIIQHGPQCGLVALSMASQVCGTSSSSSRCQSAVPPATPTTPGTTASGLSPAELLESAQAEGFSTHGEMFNAEALANLANMKLGDSVEASVRRGVLEDKHVFLELILSGALILVPYDAQPNHQPGKYNGHKAHWGVVSGALVQSRKFSSGVASAAAFSRPDTRIDNLWHVRRGYHSSSRSSSRPSSRASSRADDAQRLPEDEKISTKSRRERSSSPPWRRVEPERTSRSMTPGGMGRGLGGAPNETALFAFLNVAPDDMAIVVLWRQGKSRALVSSTLEELCASNAQLSDYPQAQTDSGLEKDFVIGDVRRGLAGQVVVLNKTTLPLTALSDLLDRLQK